jgi:hypothetical protein
VFAAGGRWSMGADFCTNNGLFQATGPLAIMVY